MDFRSFSMGFQGGKSFKSYWNWIDHEISIFFSTKPEISITLLGLEIPMSCHQFGNASHSGRHIFQQLKFAACLAVQIVVRSNITSANSQCLLMKPTMMSTFCWWHPQYYQITPSFCCGNPSLFMVVSHTLPTLRRLHPQTFQTKVSFAPSQPLPTSRGMSPTSPPFVATAHVVACAQTSWSPSVSSPDLAKVSWFQDSRSWQTWGLLDPYLGMINGLYLMSGMIYIKMIHQHLNILGDDELVYTS